MGPGGGWLVGGHGAIDFGVMGLLVMHVLTGGGWLGLLAGVAVGLVILLRRARRVVGLGDAGGVHRFLDELAVATQRLVAPEEIMAETARRLAEYLGADRCAYAEVEDEEVFVITGDYSRGVPSIVGRWPVAAFGPELLRRMKANEPFITEDVANDPRLVDHREAYRQTTIEAVICVPLHKAGRFTAAMAVHQKAPRRWTNEELELVLTVVGRCWESLERARADRQLKATVDQLVLALSTSQLGNWSWDAATDLATFSPRLAEIFGIGPEPMRWSEMEKLLHEDDRGPIRRAAEEAMARGEQYDVEYRVMRGAGQWVWVSSKGRAQYDASGKPLGMFGVVQDITERKNLEHDLRRHAAELAEADRRKDDFIALLAHELRNPLAPIRTGLEILGMEQASGPVREEARQMMQRQLGHMVRMVDDLLDVSRIARNKLLLQTRPIELREVVEHALESARPHLDGHQLEVALPDESVVIEGDLTRLTQVFGNLLSNAAKFSPAGARVRLAAELSGGEVRVCVSDDGIGIDPDDLPRIFELFVQVDRMVTRGGLGIGLGLVKALVEMHGGSIVATSAGLGTGSTFTVTLPLAARPTRADAPSGSRSAVLTGMKVLIADDSKDGAGSLRYLLELLGAEVAAVHDGADAVARADELRPDLILMDIGMPDMDGLTASRVIRSRPWGAQPWIIAITGWGRDEDRRRSRAAGCDGHLVKPVGLAELQELVTTLRSRSSSQG